MNAETVINAAIVVVLAASSVALYRLCRTPRPPLAERVRHARARIGLPPATTVHDVGPDALRLLQETDLHLNRYVLEDDRLSAHFANDEACDRLRDAIDEHRKENPS